MKKLLLSRNDLLLDPGKPDTVLWQNMHKLVTSNVNFVDRCDHVKMPYQFKNDFPMVRDLSGFNTSYRDLVLERAQKLLEHQRRTGLPMVLLYSGGMDSTLMLIAFKMVCAGQTQDIHVALNSASLRENPRFYHQHIRGKFRLLSSETSLDLFDGQWMIVGGEFNDQLFGNDLYEGILAQPGGQDLLYAAHDQNNFTNIVTKLRSVSEESAKFWYGLINEQIRSTQLCEISTVKDFFWWINFSFKWQSVYYRMIERARHRELINRDFLDRHYHQFYITDDFQRWSMLNPDKKIGRTWPSYKVEAKKFIFDYTRDQDFFDNKVKFGSLSTIFRQRGVPDALDEDFKHVNLSDPSAYYVPDNSFRI